VIVDPDGFDEGEQTKPVNVQDGIGPTVFIIPMSHLNDEGGAEARNGGNVPGVTGQ
jgi:hypothetical protein